jgi:Transposase, Mutator family
MTPNATKANSRLSEPPAPAQCDTRILGVYHSVRTEGEAPTALSESAVSELLDAFRAGEGVALTRDAVQLLLQELIEVAAAEQIGAGRFERVDSRVTERNGSRPVC